MQSQAINQFPQQPYTVTNNVSRVTFEYVRDNPGQRNGEICSALEAKGYKRGSVSSLLGQMAMAGLIRRDADRKIWAAKPEYEPFSTYTLNKLRGKVKTKKPVAQTRAMKNYLPPQPTPAPPPEVRVVNSVDELIDTLTVAQARDLFARLKRMFA